MEVRVTSEETKIEEIEIACNFISGEADTQKTEIRKAQDRIRELDKSCKQLEQALKASEQKTMKKHQRI